MAAQLPGRAAEAAEWLPEQVWEENSLDELVQPALLSKIGADSAGLGLSIYVLEQRTAKAWARHRYHSSCTARRSFCSAALPGTEAGVLFGPCRECQDRDQIPEDLGKGVERQRKFLWSERWF